jgi:hypothetical protein
MPSWLRDALEYITKEGRVIRDAPVAFGAFVVLVALVIWAALSWKFDTQISSRDAIIAARDATIKMQDGLIGEYKNRVQLPEAGEDRKLTPEQRRIIANGLRSNPEEFKTFVIYAVDEREPRQYAKQFASIAEDVLGARIYPREISPIATTELGLFVGVRGDINHPPKAAQDFMDILLKANLVAHYTPWGGVMPGAQPEEQNATFDLFVARTPW